MDISDELERLSRLHRVGSLSDEEFTAAKARLLESCPPPAPSADREQAARQWALFLHLSLLAGYLAPLAGFVAPIVIWQWKKQEYPILDVHGKIVLNWMLSLVIYAAVSVILCLVLIGVPLLIALGILSIVYPIVGGLKANNGDTWRYPLSIEFLRIPGIDRLGPGKETRTGLGKGRLLKRRRHMRGRERRLAE